MIIVMGQTLSMMNKRGYQIALEEDDKVIEYPTYVKIIKDNGNS